MLGHVLCGKESLCYPAFKKKKIAFAYVDFVMYTCKDLNYR